MQAQSYSMISTAYKCHRMYKLQHIDKIREEGPGSSALEFGTAMHTALQASLEGANSLDVFNLYWNLVKDKDVKYFRHNWQMLADMAETFLARFERLHAKHFEIERPMEQRLYGTLNGFKVEGTPDFVGKYKGIPSILDFKTSAIAYTKDRIVCNEQMHMYAHLAKQQLDYKPKQIVYIVFAKDSTRIQTQVRELKTEEHKGMLDNITKMCEDIKQRTVWPMNRNSCLAKGVYRCSFWDHCYGDNK